MPVNPAGGPELRVRFAADTASVPGARRFVADGLTSWGRPALVDDASLCVTELAANAALHSASTFMEVAVRALDDAVRISVEDDGVTPAEAVAPRRGLTAPDAGAAPLPVDEEPTTGRGLMIVSILASDWGVDRTEVGKRIWADLSGSGQIHEVRQPTTSAGAAPESHMSALPKGWHLARLPGCPVQLSLRQDQHLDELIRELQLMEGDAGSARSRELAQRLQGLLSGPAHARHTGRRFAQNAAAAGQEFIDIEMAMPAEFSAEVKKLQAAVQAADELCEQRQLLTLASSPEVREIRAWMTACIVDQIEKGADPVTYTDWVAGRR